MAHKNKNDKKNIPEISPFSNADSQPLAEEKPPVAVRYGVRIGELGLLIPAGVFSEVIVGKGIYSLPNTQPWLLGVTNDRGDVVPVYDLAQLFNVQAVATKQDILLVIDQKEYAVAIRIWEYPKVVRGLAEQAALPTLPNVLEGYVSQAFVVGDEVWLEFNHRDFLTSLKSTIAV